MNAHKLPSGNYRVQGTYKDRNGNTIRKSFTAKTAKEALRMAYEFDVLSVTTEDDKITLAEAMKAYNEIKTAVLSPSTIREYYSLSEQAFNGLKELKLNEFTTVILQKWVNAFSKNHSPKYTKNAYFYLLTVLKYNKIPCDFDVTLPAKKKIEYHVITDDEMKTLLKETAGTDLGIAIALAAFIPARRSEICALRQSDIDRVNNTIRINKSVVRNEIGQWVEKNTTKTYESTRTVEVPKAIIDMIPKDRDKIFEFAPSVIHGRFERLKSRLGFSFRFHDLRHYGATFLHAQGIPDKYIMQRGGWSNVSTLQNIYTHCLPEETNIASSAVNNKFNALI